MELLKRVGRTLAGDTGNLYIVTDAVCIVALFALEFFRQLLALRAVTCGNEVKLFFGPFK
jgi:hypothetical protein